MSVKYENPPIMEALCEFQFIPNQKWDLTIPGLFYEEIRDKFPTKEQVKTVSTKVQSGKTGVEQTVDISDRLRFLREDKTALVQIGTEFLAVNQLTPYPSWDVFRPMIINSLEKYRSIANPKGFKQIRLRYINRIVLDKENFTFKDYFNYLPSYPQEFESEQTRFKLACEIPRNDSHGRLSITLANTFSDKPDTIAIVLDLSYIVTEPVSISFEDAPKCIETAHNSIEEGFEACITDKCRKIFKRV